MSGRTRCGECGYPIWPGQPAITVLYSQVVHVRCRDGVPEHINPNPRFVNGEEVCK